MKWVIKVESRFLEPPSETEIGEFEKSEVNSLQCLAEEGTRLLVRVIGRLEKLVV